MFANTELIEVVRAKALTLSAANVIGPELPLGEGWARLHGRINLAITTTTASGAVSEGELQVVSGVFMKTDAGEVICNNTPLRHLYRASQQRLGTAPVKDAIAASTATYRVPFDIWFSDPRLRPEEAHLSALDTKRYGSILLQFTLGGLSSLFGTVGDAACVATLDLYVERFKGKMPYSPEFYPTYGVFPPQVPSNQTFIDMEKSVDLAYKRLLAYTTSGSTAGAPMTGTAVNTVINDMDVEGTEKFHMQNALADVVQRQGQIDYSLESIPAGVHWFCPVDKARSLRAALRSGGQSKLRLNWRNQSLPSTPQVTLAYEGVRRISK